MAGIGRKMGMALRPLRGVMVVAAGNLAPVSRWAVYKQAAGGFSTIDTEQSSCSFAGGGTTARAGFDITIPTTPGQAYTLKLTASNSYALAIGTTLGGSDIMATANQSAATDAVFGFTALAATTYIRMDKAGTATVTIRNVSVM